jgi:hypothetical protein
MQESLLANPCFSSTRMRCITAICPAGPPKESSATRAQTRHASPGDTRV